MTKTEYDEGCARALDLVQTCRAEEISGTDSDGEWHGWRLHLDDINGSIEGFGDATEAEARAGALEHVKARLGIPTDAELADARVKLRGVRDAWLVASDHIEGYLAEPSAFAFLPQPVRDTIDENATAWREWRQQLRDLPATVDDLEALALVQDVPAAWPQPPAAPTISLP